MLPVTPDRFTIERPGGLDGDIDDYWVYEDDEPVTDGGEPVSEGDGLTVIGAGVPCTFATPGGSDTVANGRQELVDAVLLFPATPLVERTDFAVNDRTGDRYRVTWVRPRHGLGLDHQRIGLAAVAGGSGG